VVLHGRIVEMGALRHTPAGIALQRFTLRHTSDQIEAGVKRRVLCEIEVVGLAGTAQQAARLKRDDEVAVEGFLARESARSAKLVLHINKLKSI
ncbi:MAG: primosomal replication protein N, partial [Burkholderiales bacterium]